MSPEKKIGILVLCKWTDDNFTMPPEKWVELRQGFDETAKRWEKKGVSAFWYNCVMMGKFDAFVVYEVNDLADWVEMGEEFMRHWGKYIKDYEVHIGVNPTYFNEATKDIPYWKAFRKRFDELGIKYG